MRGLRRDAGTLETGSLLMRGLRRDAGTLETGSVPDARVATRRGGEHLWHSKPNIFRASSRAIRCLSSHEKRG
jgi:hypothetical protein